MWPLDPFPRENGGTRLWPGSHLDPDIPGMDEDEAIVPRLSPGDALLFLGSTLHGGGGNVRSEEHTSELQSLMRISYAVFCLKKKKKIYIEHYPDISTVYLQSTRIAAIFSITTVNIWILSQR